MEKNRLSQLSRFAGQTQKILEQCPFKLLRNQVQ